MATLTIRNLPDELHEFLKERARMNRRSVNQEVIAELSEITKDADLSAKRKQWERANRLVDEMRAGVKDFPSLQEIRDAIEEGRK